MKIHFAYRSGYIPNNRYLKTFEADSVLDWFVQNWDALTTEEKDEQLLGVSVYGLPFTNHDSEEKVAAPKNLKDLKEKIESHVYSNEVFVRKNCIQVHTDDDEIELAWYVFDEEYAATHPEKTKLWFTEKLPVTHSEKAYEGTVKGKTLFKTGSESYRTYYLSSVIYDSCNFDELQPPTVLKGVRLPDLLPCLRATEPIEADEDGDYRQTEMLLLQQFAKIYGGRTEKEIFEELAKYSFSDFDSESIELLTSDSLEKSNLTNEGSIVNYSPHLVEIMMHWKGFYNYVVLFDDFWLNENTELGLSLMQFHKDWKI